MMIVHEAREPLKQRAFFGLFHMAFKGKVAFGFGQTEYGIKHRQKFKITTFVMLWTPQKERKRFEGSHDDFLGTADQKTADHRAKNDHEFKRLIQHAHVAAPPSM